MKITKQARHEAKQLFRSCLADGLLEDKKVREVVTRVIQAKPRGYLAILTHFERLLKLEIARRTARVESATPLAPDLQAQIQQGLAQSYGKGLNISFGQDPALVGGLRIKVGSDVYDGSVQGRLAALQESF
ncbi:MAG TPA: F0F1 ATP synthase subunit delta [Candidatus Dormibacteraeota bacterium]|nr:F0F1 ATP synthase subunit delta [Candidatus Dormibacteraeota bacterium]